MKETREILNKIAKFISSVLHEKYGFCLLVFKYDKQSQANYISNCDKKDMVKALFETAYRLKEERGDEN